MIENQELITTDEETLPAKVYSFFSEGYRLVQIHCTRVDAGFELNYSFDKDYHFTNIRLVIDKDKEIASISRIYWNAFLYENEISDLFGVKIKNIVLDYHGKFYQTATQAPFSKPKPEEKKEANKEETKAEGS
jgi:ech hydrogenase subunit D